MKSLSRPSFCFGIALVVALLAGGCAPSSSSTDGNAESGSQKGSRVTLLNVSYDPTREFYQEFNQQFSEHWLKTTGTEVTIEQSHGGSGKQGRAVIDGLEADVVTLALAFDIDAIAERSGLLSKDWQKRFPHNSTPYQSTIVFMVRKGNPKQIANWDDLVAKDVQIVIPNPKTSGGARWIYLAAWGFALRQKLGDLTDVSGLKKDPKFAEAEKAAQDFVKKIFQKVQVLDSGARGATNTFVQRQIGDVLLTWENEAHLALQEIGKDQVEIVTPPLSILAEPPVAVVDQVTAKHGTTDVARGYLEFLYSPEGQRLAAKHHYRPATLAEMPNDIRQQFPKIELFSVEQVFGGWSPAQAKHFADGGVFDQIYQPANAQ